ncbi:hypothetical protein B0I37DRAFT_363153 [Chaetomium sp. MPI-CAGE-AT-0009]|nr:hypothetical protein B0I37DRAFT_363153 [Chaetomium sp. MPI-CAGE-AT-0009]
MFLFFFSSIFLTLTNDDPNPRVSGFLGSECHTTHFQSNHLDSQKQELGFLPSHVASHPFLLGGRGGCCCGDASMRQGAGSSRLYPNPVR